MYIINHPIRNCMKKSIRPVLPVLALLLLLTHPSLSFQGAQNGLLLWFNVILPTLLPFMLCSVLLVSRGGVPILIRPLKPLFSLLHLSEEGSYCLLCGLLCGYPMGAKTTADFLRENRIRMDEGKRLLAIAGCPSPMFLAGYLRPRLPKGTPFLFVVLALYLPVLLIGILSRDRRVRTEKTAGQLREVPNHRETPFDELLMNCLEIMVKIGGFLMIYSILAAFLQIIPDRLLPVSAKAALIGLTEMTTGIDFAFRFLSGPTAAVMMLVFAAFGGLSGISQTQTVIKNAGLSIRQYVRWKLIHASLSGALLILLLFLQQLPHRLLPAL